MDVKDKRVTVIGIGESGKSAAFFLKRKGANVYATDSGNSKELKVSASQLKSFGINVEIGRHSKNFIKDSEFIIISPGVPDESPAVKWAKELKKEIISEIELGFRFCKGKIIAITGTNGKSTTATLLAQMLNKAGKDTIFCGNIGDAFTKKIDQIHKNTIVVLEISSFQLEHIKTFKPRISVILNISQNHLDRHSDMEEYLSAKKRIYQYQSKDDYVILNYDDKNLRELKDEINSNILFFSRKDKIKGAYADKNKLFLNIKTPQEISFIEDLKLKQPHNIENFLAASLCVALYGVPIETMADIIRRFEGLEHRLKHVATIKGVDFIDDSKATTVDATRAALRSVPGAVVLIAGGRNKGSDFRLADKEIKEKVKALILIGESKQQMRKELSDFANIKEADDMNEAVDTAARIAQEGENVLLSPMCASFDMYKNYKERGDAFKKAVAKLKEA